MNVKLDNMGCICLKRTGSHDYKKSSIVNFLAIPIEIIKIGRDLITYYHIM